MRKLKLKRFEDLSDVRDYEEIALLEQQEMKGGGGPDSTYVAPADTIRPDTIRPKYYVAPADTTNIQPKYKVQQGPNVSASTNQKNGSTIKVGYSVIITTPSGTFSVTGSGSYNTHSGYGVDLSGAWKF